MDWQIIAIWVIGGATLFWFSRSEQRQKFAALAEKARFFALDPAYRHRPTAPVSSQQSYVPTGLSQSDRVFLEAIAKNARAND